MRHYGKKVKQILKSSLKQELVRKALSINSRLELSGASTLLSNTTKTIKSSPCIICYKRQRLSGIHNLT